MTIGTSQAIPITINRVLEIEVFALLDFYVDRMIIVCYGYVHENQGYHQAEECLIIMHRFLVIIEKANGNYSAYSPDLPGCVATGKTTQETEQNMYEALQMHLKGMAEDNQSLPESSSLAEYVMIK